MTCVKKTITTIAGTRREPFNPHNCVEELVCQVLAILVVSFLFPDCLVGVYLTLLLIRWTHRKCSALKNSISLLILDLLQVTGREFSDKDVQALIAAFALLEKKHLHIVGRGVELEYMPW